MRIGPCAAAVALGIAFAATPVHAQVLVSNLVNAANDGYAVFAGQWLAQGFMNDDETRYLEGVYANVSNNFGAGGMIAEIRTSDAGNPGDVVGTFSVFNPALTLLPMTPIELAPNTTYFVMLGFPVGNPNTMGAWKATANLASTGPGSLTEPRYSHNQGATWQSAGLAMQRLRIEVVVPAPRAAALGATACAALLVLRRLPPALQRRRSASTSSGFDISA